MNKHNNRSLMIIESRALVIGGVPEIFLRESLIDKLLGIYMITSYSFVCLIYSVPGTLYFLLSPKQRRVTSRRLSKYLLKIIRPISLYTPFMVSIRSRIKPQILLYQSRAQNLYYISSCNHNNRRICSHTPTANPAEHECSIIAKSKLSPVVGQLVVTPESLPHKLRVFRCVGWCGCGVGRLRPSRGRPER